MFKQSSLRVQAFRVWMFPENKNSHPIEALRESTTTTTSTRKKQNTRFKHLSFEKEEPQKFQPLDWCGVSSLHSALVYVYAYTYSQVSRMFSVFLCFSTWFCNLSKKDSRAFKESGQTIGLTMTTTTAAAWLINKRM